MARSPPPDAAARRSAGEKFQVRGRTVVFKQLAGFGGRLILAANRPALYEVLWFRFARPP